VDDKGKTITENQHLLSMKDNNQSNNVLALAQAGVSSFKIEGRYKTFPTSRTSRRITAPCSTKC
jgi:collagenase-like PrtC family protease